MTNRYCLVHRNNDKYKCQSTEGHKHACCRFCTRQCSHPCRGARDDCWRTCTVRVSFWRFHFGKDDR